MHNGNPGREDLTALPPDAMPCVWMAAGLLAYRLCDRNFDCEGCPLDAAMRGKDPRPERASVRRVRGEPETAKPVRGKKLRRVSFPSDRKYHVRGHTWVRRRRPGVWRCGVDALVARILDRVPAVVLPAVGARLAASRTGFWVDDGYALLPMVSPVSGTVTAINESLRRSPSTMLGSPYGRGWLFEVRTGPGDEAKGLQEAGPARDAARRGLARFNRAIVEATRPRRSEVGPTLPDGGVPLTSPSEILGPRRFHELVFSLIGCA